MRTLAIIIATSLTILAAGCGGSATGDSSTQSEPASNDAKIEQATQSETSEDELRAKLDDKLKLYSSSSVTDEKDTFKLESGDLCSLDGIYVGDTTDYAGEDNALMSPDGTAMVEVLAYEDDSTAACMSAARDALGW
jgi:hypothetical protein